MNDVTTILFAAFGNEVLEDIFDDEQIPSIEFGIQIREQGTMKEVVANPISPEVPGLCRFADT